MWGRLRKADAYLSEAEERASTAGERGVTSLAREVVLAALDPDTGKIWNNARFAVPAALLVELVHHGRLQVSGSGGKTEVSVRDDTPLGDADLDEALAMVGSGLFGQRVTRLVGRVPQTGQVVDRMVADGLLAEESRRLLGVVPQRRHQPTAAAGREQVVARLRDALLGASVPDERTVLLVSCLIGVHEKVYVPKDRAKEARARVVEVRAGVGEDVGAVIAAARAAMGNSNGDPTSGL